MRVLFILTMIFSSTMSFAGDRPNMQELLKSLLPQERELTEEELDEQYKQERIQAQNRADRKLVRQYIRDLNGQEICDVDRETQLEEWPEEQAQIRQEIYNRRIFGLKQID